VDIAVVLAQLEGNAVVDIRIALLSQRKFKVFLIGTHQPAFAVIPHIFSSKNRRHVSGAKRLKLLKYAVELIVNVAQLDSGVNLNLGHHKLRGDGLAYVLLETVFKVLDIFKLKRQPGSVHVATKVFEQVGAGLYRLVEIVARYRPCRPGCQITRLRKHNCRPVVGFNQPRGNYTHHTLMPRRVEENR